jgi:hypothetical protein
MGYGECPLWVIRVNLAYLEYVRLRGSLGSTGPPVLPVEGIGLDVIQASKPEPRIMRYEPTDFEWAAIRSFLPTKPRGIPRVDDRRVLNGIFWQFDRCFFNKIKRCRRVATRHDKLAANYLAFIKLASIRIWPRANESTP